VIYYKSVVWNKHEKQKVKALSYSSKMISWKQW